MTAEAHFLAGSDKLSYEYWTNFSSWTVKEGVLLSLGIRPDSPYTNYQWDEKRNTFKRPDEGMGSTEDVLLRVECTRRMRIALRAVEDGTLQAPIKPYTFLEWLISVGFSSPQELVESFPAPVQKPVSKYSTPYLDLMRTAIQHFGITEQNQEKAEILTAWFETQNIAGEPVSNNEAKKLASFIRLPASKKGGNKPAKPKKG